MIDVIELEALEDQTEEQYYVSYENEPECIGTDEGDADKATDQPQRSQDNTDPKGILLWRCEFHEFFSLDEFECFGAF